MRIGHPRGVTWLLLIALGASFTACSSTSPGTSPTASPAVPNPQNATLSASVQRLDRTSGAVAINGVDTRRPTKPFHFDWGDRTSSQNFFPATHIYVDLRRNYTVKITATYEDGTTQTIAVPVFFVDSKQSPPTAPKSRY